VANFVCGHTLNICCSTNTSIGIALVRESMGDAVEQNRRSRDGAAVAEAQERDGDCAIVCVPEFSRPRILFKGDREISIG
jgi:hypothetical protein